MGLWRAAREAIQRIKQERRAAEEQADAGQQPPAETGSAEQPQSEFADAEDRYR